MTRTVGGAIEELRAAMSGVVFTPEDPDYDQARLLWNADADRRPEVVARCGSTGDVVAALRYAQAEGLEIVTDDPAAGRIEGVATSFWFEFKDDVAARITRDGGAWSVDLRSISRVGRSDLGANCARVTALAERLYPARRERR